MKVNLFNKKTIQDYTDGHPAGRSPFDHWLTVIKYADWDDPDDIKKTFGTADLLGNGSARVIFNIGGNNYRLIAKYYFGQESVDLFVKWIGTHFEYNKLCENLSQFDVDDC